jgi:hypothetical protein
MEQHIFGCCPFAGIICLVCETVIQAEGKNGVVFNMGKHVVSEKHKNLSGQLVTKDHRIAFVASAKKKLLEVAFAVARHADNADGAQSVLAPYLKQSIPFWFCSDCSKYFETKKNHKSDHRAAMVKKSAHFPVNVSSTLVIPTDYDPFDPAIYSKLFRSLLEEARSDPEVHNTITVAKQNNCTIDPPTKKQRTSSAPMALPAETLRVSPIYAPSLHGQFLLPPYRNAPQYSMPMPLPGAFQPTCTPPWFRGGYPAPFQLPQSHQQFLPAHKLMAIFGFTPFGIHCQICKNHVGSSRQVITEHLISNRHGPFSKEAVLAFEETAGKKVQQLLMSKRANLNEFLVGQSQGYACPCEAVFRQKKALARHCKETKSCCFGPNDARPELLHRTVCHRLISQAVLDRLSSSLTTTEHLNFSGTEEALKKYIRADEETGPYIAIFHPFYVSCGLNFDSRVSDMVGWWKMEAGVEELGLHQVLVAAKTWLNASARRLVEMVPGNLRAGLQVFDGQEVGEVSQNYLYSFRHHEKTLLPEIVHLLSFAWRYPTSLLASFKKSANARDPKLVPALLGELVLENVEGFTSHPLVVQYCLARCFRMQSNKIVMASCGDNASTVAAVLSILRAGICSDIVMLNMSDQQAKDFVQKARQSRVFNIICPMVRRLREMQRRKPKTGRTSVSPEGDIAVDGFDFPRNKWSKLVPSVLATCRERLALLLEGNEWLLFLDANTPLSVYRTERGRFIFSLSTSGKEVKSSQLVLKQRPDHALILDEIRAHVEIGFHGFGGGSMRYQELTRLTLRNIIWHFGTLYYSAESIKQFTSNSKKVNITDRKLPIEFARMYLLYDLVARTGDSDIGLLPACSNPKHSMQDAIATIFNFSERPSALQIRHLWTSISNVTFPNGQNAIVSATAEAAEMCGHTEGTHAGRYGSELIGGAELNYRKYHNAMGAADGTSVSNEQIQAGNLFDALTQIYGPGATYTSEQQENMVVASARKKCLHSHVGLPCG